MTRFFKFSLPHVAEFLDLPISTVEQMAGLDNPLIKKGSTNRHVNYMTVKYCPECTFDCFHHQEIWKYVPICCCLLHQCLLVDRCQGCEQTITIDTFCRGSCPRCGFRYRNAKVQRLSEDDLILKMQQLIQGKLCNKEYIDKSVPILTGYSLDNLLSLCDHSFYLLHGLNSFIHDELAIQIGCFQNSKVHGKYNMNSAVCYGNIYWMYLNFPQNFLQVLELFCEKKPKVLQYQRIRHEKLYTNPIYNAIGKIYNSYWGNRAKMINIPVVEEKRVKAPYVRKGKPKRVCAVSNNIIVEEKINEKTNYVTRRETAAMLGISAKVQINVLIEAGFFTLKQFSNNLWLIEKPEVDNFLKKINNCAVYRKIRKSDIRFYSAINKYSKFGLNVQKLVSLIFDSYLAPIKNASFVKLPDLYFNQQDLANYIGEIKEKRRQEIGYTLTDLRRLLKMELQSLRELESQKILVPKTINILKDGRKQRIYNKIEVDNFLSNHCSIKQAIFEYNIPSRMIRNWMNEGKLTDYFKGASRKYLIRRDELQVVLKKY